MPLPLNHCFFQIGGDLEDPLVRWAEMDEIEADQPRNITRGPQLLESLQVLFKEAVIFD